VTRRGKKRILWGLAAFAGLILTGSLAGLYVRQTDWCKNKVRAKIISVAETASGGRVEIGSFNYNWHNMTA